MKLILVIFIWIFLLSLVYAENYTRADCLQRLSWAEKEIDKLGAALNDSYTQYNDTFSKCDEPNKIYQTAYTDAVNANNSFEDGYRYFTIDRFNTSYNRFTSAGQTADDGIAELANKLPLAATRCRIQVQQDATSYSLVQTRNERAKAQAVMGTVSGCVNADTDWKAAELQYTAANAMFASGGSDFIAAKNASDTALSLYLAVQQDVRICAQTPSKPVANTTSLVPGSCNKAADCAANELCNQGKCQQINCACGYIENHVCNKYDCCMDADCMANQQCQSHECVAKTLPPAPSPTPQPVQNQNACPLGAILLLGVGIGVFKMSL